MEWNAPRSENKLNAGKYRENFHSDFFLSSYSTKAFIVFSVCRWRMNLDNADFLLPCLKILRHRLTDELNFLFVSVENRTVAEKTLIKDKFYFPRAQFCWHDSFMIIINIHFSPTYRYLNKEHAAKSCLEDSLVDVFFRMRPNPLTLVYLWSHQHRNFQWITLKRSTKLTHKQGRL